MLARLNVKMCLPMFQVHTTSSPSSVSSLATSFPSLQTRRAVRSSSQGAVHKVRHAIFGQFLPPVSHYVTHPGTSPESTSHISDPPIFRRPSTENPDKSPLYKCCLNCSREFLSGGFCQGVFCLEGFVWVVF